jgi:cbb3-type cytochrome oxidase subunit 3
MDLNILRSLVTLLGFFLFLALMAWTWWPSHRGAAERAARLPFEDDTETRDMLEGDRA